MNFGPLMIDRDELLANIYDELRQLAGAKLALEKPGHTLDATALVHEVYLKLGGQSIASQSGYFRAAATAMQRILVDHARAKRAEKRGGDGRRFDLNESDGLMATDPDTLLAIHEALEQLGVNDADAADVARLRLFAGLTVENAAESLGLSRATAFRNWAFAKAWLSNAIAPR